ncbi:MAG: hypothetical protein M1832_001745 [Thelocarpon impressellum]|nr:MAG: hypothetical protein M1832_001745 [Thelocarpon impressellum]
MTLGDRGALAVDGSAAWNIPTALLRAELARRDESPAKPKCGSGAGRGSYNTSLHVAALIIILTLSTVACSFPIVVRRFPKLRVPHHFLFISRHFGTGVLIATAFVHLLPTAFVSLTDPCLPAFWNEGYTAMAGLIAMTSVLIVVGIEMFFATRGAGHMHASEYDAVPVEGGSLPLTHVGNGAARPSHQRQLSLRPFSQGKIGDDVDDPVDGLNGSSENLVAGRSPSIPSASPLPREASKYTDDTGDDSDLDLDELDPVADGGAGPLATERQQDDGGESRRPPHASHHHHHPGPSHPHAHTSLSEMQEQRKMLLQCLLLEAGILFHSVFIGMALSVATGTSFIVLLLAISFHQTFEGLALGSRIAAIPALSPTSVKPWLMALAYGTTTPLGQAIGLLVHNLYDPASQTGLLMVGIMNAISSGLLLFAGLVELLAEDFLSDKSYEVLRGRRRIEASASVVGGALLMAFVGAWA